MSKPQTKEIPAKQGNPTERSKGEVGYCQPPEDSQFKPGQSGNPAGPPKRRTQLWVYINQFMEMTDAELAKVERPALTQAQKFALKLVERATQGKDCGSERLGPVLRRPGRGQGLRAPGHRQGQRAVRRRVRRDPGRATEGL